LLVAQSTVLEAADEEMNIEVKGVHLTDLVIIKRTPQTLRSR